MTAWYGYVFSQVASAKDTIFTIVAGLIANPTTNDMSRYIEVTLNGAVRSCAAVEEARGIREIVLKIVTKAGVPLKHEEVPNI